MQAELPNTIPHAQEGLAQVETDVEPYQILLVLTLAAANFLNTLAVQSAVIILPIVGRDIGIPIQRQQWLISAYYLAYGCFLLPLGRVADIYGRRTVFIAGTAWVMITTVITPFASNEIGFEVLRAMQGVGGAANVSAGLGILGGAFRPGKARNAAYSIYGAAHSLGTILGILFGGLIANYLNWKWVFWIFAILAGILTATASVTLRTISRTKQSRNDVDWLGASLITGSLVLLNFTLTQAGIVGWQKHWIPPVLVLSIILAIIFLAWQQYLETKTTRAPLLRPSIWLNSGFAATQAILALFFGAFNNLLFFATYYYQDYLSHSIIRTTLHFMPMGIVGLLASLAAARLMAIVRADLLLSGACLTVASSCLVYALPIPPSTTYWATGFIVLCLAAIGSDILAPTLTLFTALSLPAEDQAVGGGVCNAVVQLGRVVSLASATAVQASLDRSDFGMENDTAGNRNYLQSLRAAQYFNTGLAVTAGILCVWAFKSGVRIGTIRT